MKAKQVTRPEPPALTYSIDQLSRAANLSRAEIYNHINAGRLKTLKVGRRRLVTPDAARAFLAGFEQ